jgi:hypothetical protein
MTTILIGPVTFRGQTTKPIGPLTAFACVTAKRLITMNKAKDLIFFIVLDLNKMNE